MKKFLLDLVLPYLAISFCFAFVFLDHLSGLATGFVFSLFLTAEYVFCLYIPNRYYGVMIGLLAIFNLMFFHDPNGPVSDVYIGLFGDSFGAPAIAFIFLVGIDAVAILARIIRKFRFI